MWKLFIPCGLIAILILGWKTGFRSSSLNTQEPQASPSHKKEQRVSARDSETGPRSMSRFSRESMAERLQTAWQGKQYDQAEEDMATWLDHDPRSAFQFVNQLTDASQANHYAAVLFQYLSLQDPDEAWELASFLQNWPKVRISVVSDHFTKLMEQDRDHAIKLLKDLSPEESQVATTLAYQSTRQGVLGNPRNTIESLLASPPHALQADLISGSLEHWMVSSIDDATDFLNTSEPNELFDKAAMIYSERAAFLDPQAAMSWADSLVHPSLRQEAQRRVREIWKKEDPSSFEQWLHQQNE